MKFKKGDKVTVVKALGPLGRTMFGVYEVGEEYEVDTHDLSGNVWVTANLVIHSDEVELTEVYLSPLYQALR